VSGKILTCTEAEYRALDAANYSTLKEFRKSAAHAKYAMDNPREPTPAMIVGSAVDCLIFHPDLFPSRFAVAPECDRRTKDGKATWAAFTRDLGARYAITTMDLDRARYIALGIAEHPTARKLMNARRFQTPIVWDDEVTGVRCKALIDAMTPGLTITDCKTTRDATERGFSRQAATLAYHWQAAMYCDGWKACTGEELPYTFIVAANEPPHVVGVYRLDDAAIHAGRAQYREKLREWQRCRESGVWPALSDTLVTLELSRWALDGAPIVWDDDHPF
jgi:hypothetical protein